MLAKGPGQWPFALLNTTYFLFSEGKKKSEIVEDSRISNIKLHKGEDPLYTESAGYFNKLSPV